MNNFFIQTFGCQMNEHDSEIMAGLLMRNGYQPCDSKEDAGLIVLNTCSIRDNADQRFFGTLGQLKNLKEKNGDLLIAVCGCMMQQEHVVQKLKRSYPWVDLVFGTHNFYEIAEMLEAAKRQKKMQVHILEKSDTVDEMMPARRLYPHKALVNIMYGCNNFCTYCIVPYTRGREKSRTPNAIVSEIEALAGDGVREVMLLGQNVNSYAGVDKNGRAVSFAELLEMVNDISGIDRIRFMTSHPKDFSTELISAYGKLQNLCKAVHLPVQSGSNAVLKRMNRRYTREQYLKIVRSLRNACPGIAITTDIIVGFPGETEEDFLATLDLCRTVSFDSAFTFIYSQRPGTPAAEYADQIPYYIAHERFDRLVEQINSDSLKHNMETVGKELDVIVDECAGGRCSGRTESFKPVNFSADATAGDMFRLRITDANTFALSGEVV